MKKILVTGAGGYIGGQVIQKLASHTEVEQIIALDIREAPPNLKDLEKVIYFQGDIRNSNIAPHFEGVNVIIHLASIVNPGQDREFEYSVDVLGTQNILDICLQQTIEKIIVTSSGAAYGYYPDNPDWLRESDPIRGNPEFSYSDHKRRVEEMLADYRQKHPKLQQLIFRPGTVLGKTVSNRITNLFEKPVVMGIQGSPSPFVFIWDQDVVNCIVLGATTDRTGIYNLAGDGMLTMKEIAQLLNKPYIPLPPNLIGGALKILKRIGLIQYGPEQMIFLQYRPVLANNRLKKEFGYIPQKSSSETFLYYRDCRK